MDDNSTLLEAGGAVLSAVATHAYRRRGFANLGEVANSYPWAVTGRLGSIQERLGRKTGDVWLGDPLSVGSRH